jgi:hypothetical protein
MDLRTALTYGTTPRVANWWIRHPRLLIVCNLANAAWSAAAAYRVWRDIR